LSAVAAGSSANAVKQTLVITSRTTITKEQARFIVHQNLWERIGQEKLANTT
jgi:hypothetical protein